MEVSALLIPLLPKDASKLKFNGLLRDTSLP